MSRKPLLKSILLSEEKENMVKSPISSSNKKSSLGDSYLHNMDYNRQNILEDSETEWNNETQEKEENTDSYLATKKNIDEKKKIKYMVIEDSDTEQKEKPIEKKEIYKLKNKNYVKDSSSDEENEESNIEKNEELNQDERTNLGSNSFKKIRKNKYISEEESEETEDSGENEDNSEDENESKSENLSGESGENYSNNDTEPIKKTKKNKIVLESSESIQNNSEDSEKSESYSITKKNQSKNEEENLSDKSLHRNETKSNELSKNRERSSKDEYDDEYEEFNESLNNIKSNITHFGKIENKNSIEESIIELSDSEQIDIASSTQYNLNVTSKNPQTPISLKKKEYEQKPIASWSPNYENVKAKIKESMKLKQEKERKVELIDLEEEEKVSKKINSQTEQKQKYQRVLETRVANRNLFNEEKLKLLSDRMLEVMENKPEPETINEFKSPRNLKVNLLPHQFYSMLWLKWREGNYPNGGILADDMGLGKTLTILSYLKLVKDEREDKLNEGENENEKYEHNNLDDDDDELKFKHLKKNKKPNKKKISYRLKTLIVLPASLLYQWQNEIKSKFDRDVFKIHIYHDANRKKYAYNLEDNDLVFTTYEIVSREIDFDKEGNQISNDSPLTGIKWKRIILDEAHRIKNHTTKANKAMCALRAKYRIAITGTPIHNSLNDLYSLVKFIHFSPLDDISLWKYVFDSANIKNPNAPNAVERQKRVDSWMSFLSDYLILRRTKTDKLHGSEKKIVDLPNKNVEIIKVKLRNEEKLIYEKIFEESKEKVKTFLLNQQNKLMGKASNAQFGSAVTDIFVYLLRLRQACCHLSLLDQCLDKNELQNMKMDVQGLEGMLESLTLDSIQSDNLNSNSNSTANLTHCLKKSFASSKLGKLVEMVEKFLDEFEDDKLIIVSQWTSVLGLISSYLKRKDINFCEINGDVNLMRRNEIVEDFNKKDKINLRVMLLSLTAGGVGLNLVGANRMFLVDIHWNPALEQQAMDRIYRVGQTKECFIFRFICENTIEERIEQIQHHKMQLAQKVCGGANAGIAATVGSAKLSLQDFRLLFKDFDNKD